MAATDYAGLGAGGYHPYLVGTDEARAVLDSVRAVRHLPKVETGNQFAVWGHSQGGQAALFTALRHGEYAPELNLVGIAAAAPPTDLIELFKTDIGSLDGKSLAALALWSWHRVFGVPLANVVTAEALPIVDALAEICVENLFDLIRQQATAAPLQTSFLAVRDVTKVEPWRRLLTANSAAPPRRNVPVFIAQGLEDTLVRAEVTRQYIQRLCEADVPVQAFLMPGVSHDLAGWRSEKAAVKWISDRFTGLPPPSSCPVPATKRTN